MDGPASTSHASTDRGSPELDERFFRFSESECWHTRRSAHCVLARHRHPLVRQLALDRIRKARHSQTRSPCSREYLRAERLGFMCAHVTSGRLRNASDGSGVLGGLGNENADTRPVLEFVYEFSPCSSCRKDAIEALARLATISDWIREECAFDAIDGIRELFASLDGPGGDSD